MRECRLRSQHTRMLIVAALVQVTGFRYIAEVVANPADLDLVAKCEHDLSRDPLLIYSHFCDVRLQRLLAQNHRPRVKDLVKAREKGLSDLESGGRRGDIPCLGKSESTNCAATNPCHFLTMREQIVQGWQKLLLRNSGWLLLFPGRSSWCINQHSCLHPIERHKNTTNGKKPLQHFRDCHGKLIIIDHILSHGTSEQRHSPTYTRANP